MTNPNEYQSQAAESRPDLPSGYLKVEQLNERAIIDETVLPWAEDQELAVARCTLQGGEEFLLANAIGTHPKLIKAADGMNQKQAQNANNMFYSRLAGYVQQAHGASVDVLRASTAPFSVHVMRNPGGQRVYFGETSARMSDGTEQRLILRLGVCNKNMQALVMAVLSGVVKPIHKR